jgi:hypothetical protein
LYINDALRLGCFIGGLATGRGGGPPQVPAVSDFAKRDALVVQGPELADEREAGPFAEFEAVVSRIGKWRKKRVCEPERTVSQAVAVAKL